MARAHRVRLSIPDLTQDQADQLAAHLGDAAAVTHEPTDPARANSTVVVMTVRAAKAATAGKRAAAQVKELLPARAPTPLWEITA